MGQRVIETDVAIVGAGGRGGAVLALMLAQQGVRSLVLERAAGPPQGHLIKLNYSKLLHVALKQHGIQHSLVVLLVDMPPFTPPIQTCGSGYGAIGALIIQPIGFCLQRMS